MEDYFGNPLDPDDVAAIGQILTEAAVWAKVGTKVTAWTEYDVADNWDLPDMQVDPAKMSQNWAGPDIWAIRDVGPEYACNAIYRNVLAYTDISDGRYVITPIGHIGLN